MVIIDKNKWSPVDGISLEENALISVKSEKNTLVVAGPGAGKSELLAQRACYLLQTNECMNPRKILAISFKKDASLNIKERVSSRCGKDLANQFKSMTFDAFAKSLLDQFLSAIPNKYRPTKDYIIVSDRECIQILKKYNIYNYFNQKDEESAYRQLMDVITKSKLPFDENKKNIEYIWKLLILDDENRCILTFKMISRLAEYLIRSNPMIKRALNMTYSHIFLDEYQDTTLLQYELFKSCFYNTEAVITAVGDDKQRIMGWAGALNDSFDRLINDFNAEKRMLIMNHRSAPRLLEIQKVLYNKYFYKNNEDYIDIIENKKWDKKEGESFLHIFENDDQEAEIISGEIMKLLEYGYKKRDICILVKQQICMYANKVIKCLDEKGIKARDEGLFQDLLKEEIVNLLLRTMRVIVDENSIGDWVYILDEFNNLKGNKKIDIYEYTQQEASINVRINEFKEQIVVIDSKEDFKVFIEDVIEFWGMDNIKSKYTQYKNEHSLKYYVNIFYDLMWKEYESCKDWREALDNFLGTDSIPIITIHKSKGLEYECIFFMGLEDSAFWSFSRQQHEDFCAFFVAISRAKRRLDFTFSKNRTTTKSQLQTKSNIEEFYSLLESSGVVEIKEWMYA